MEITGAGANRINVEFRLGTSDLGREFWREFCSSFGTFGSRFGASFSASSRANFDASFSAGAVVIMAATALARANCDVT